MGTKKDAVVRLGELYSEIDDLEKTNREAQQVIAELRTGVEGREERLGRLRTELFSLWEKVDGGTLES